MLRKLLILLVVTGMCCECGYVYSSFWAPLFDRRILNYRVDVPFEPNAGRLAREQYAKNYGNRGEKLIADLGNGKDPAEHTQPYKVYDDVKFYYT